MSEAGRSDSTAQPSVDAQGRRIHSLKNLTKSVLTDIGFNNRQYTQFKDDGEQVCGFFKSDKDKSATKLERQELYDLAEQHLFPQWKSIVDAGVQPQQQDQFWQSFMALCLRNVTAKKQHGKWVQKTQFSDGSQTAPGPGRQSVPSLPQSIQVQPSRLARSQTVSPLKGPIFAGVPQSSLLPPNSVNAAQLSPSNNTDLDASHLSRQLRQSSLDEKPDIGTGRLVRLTWRQVHLRVSFKNLSEVRRPLTMALIRGVFPDLRDTCHEDTEVVAHWLDLDSIWSNIKDHVSKYSSTGFVFDETLFAPYMRVGSGPKRIRDDNDLHIAYNSWVQDRSRNSNDIWFVMMPADTTDGSDSDVPDTEDPFANFTKTSSAKRPASPTDDSDHDPRSSKQPKLMVSVEKDEEDIRVDSSGSDQERPEANGDVDMSAAIPHPVELIGNEDVNMSGAIPDPIESVNDEDADMSDAIRDSVPPISNEDSAVNAPTEVPTESTTTVDDDEGRERSPDGETHNRPSEDTPNTDVDIVSDDETPVNVQSIQEEEDELDGPTAATEDDVERQTGPGEYEPWKLGDDEDFRSRSKGDTDSDDKDSRPTRFTDPEWRRAAGFAPSSTRRDDEPPDEEGVDTLGGDGTDAQFEQLSLQVSNNRALEQWSPEMWSTVAKFLMVSEDVRFRRDYAFPVPGGNPRNSRSPGQMFAGVWMKLNETKVMGGVLADQVGLGKTRAALVASVADRAYINKMHTDWELDQARAEEDPHYVRRHLPSYEDQEEDKTPRCPSAARWKYQCVCEWWGVTRHIREQRGATVVFASPSAMLPWIEEFHKLFEQQDDKDNYRNVGFGTKDGFLKNDKRPFRLVICHADTARNYDGKDGRPDYTMQPGDQKLMKAVLDEEEGTLRPQEFADRVVFLTTTQSYDNNLQARLKYTWSEAGKEIRGKPTSVKKFTYDYLRYGCLIFDEAHHFRSTPSILYQLIKPLKAKGQTRVGPQPYLWTVTGTPFTVDVFRDVGKVWVESWQLLCERDWEKKPWIAKNAWMEGFDSKSIEHQMRLHGQALSAKNLNRTRDQIAKAKTDYVKMAVKFASRLIIQRDEHTRIQGILVAKLPPVTITERRVKMNAQQKELVEQSWERLKKHALKAWNRAMKAWQQKGSKGPSPGLSNILQHEARNLPVVRASTSFPELVNVKREYESTLQKLYEQENQTFKEYEDRSWDELSEEEKLAASRLRLTIKEIANHRWDQLEFEKESPYHQKLEILMDNCHKKSVLDEFWDTVAGSTNAKGQKDKALVMTCSPVTALIFYNYFKYGCNNKKSKYRRQGRRMEVVLLTSTNCSVAEKEIWIQKFSDQTPEKDKFSGRKSPDILVCTTGTFGTGQNCGRARYAIITEPQPRLNLENQCCGRIRRAGYEEMVYVWKVWSPDSDYERHQKMKNEDQGELLTMVQQYERDAAEMVEDDSDVNTVDSRDTSDDEDDDEDFSTQC